MSTRPTILIVDDIAANIDVLVAMLQRHYSLKVARNGAKALQIVRNQAVDLVLLDVMMPELDGFQVCRSLKEDPLTESVPVIFITAKTEVEDESYGFQLGAVDYITKPFNPTVVKARIHTQLTLRSQQQRLEALVRERTRELEEARLESIRNLARAAEMRDNETGLHIIRVSNYAWQIALAAGLSPEEATLIRNISPLHDVGKIGISDQILLKPGRLTEDEWRIIHSHCLIGYQIIGESGGELLRNSALCAYCHHEKWDGSGYPQGLAGENIPLVARIVAIADVFDALTCARPYKRAWTLEEAITEIQRCSGNHFDPALVTAFHAALPELKSIMQKYSDSEADEASLEEAEYS